MRPAMLFAVLCTLTACGSAVPVLPTAPSELATGVVLYQHADFLGASAHVTSDVPDLMRFDGPCGYEDSDGERHYDWNDCVSSLRVAPGWRATVYEHPNYRGESYNITTRDSGNLKLVPGTCSGGGLNDCVSSVRVLRVE